jgi:hypothetical protein
MYTAQSWWSSFLIQVVLTVNIADHKGCDGDKLFLLLLLLLLQGVWSGAAPT